MAAPFVHTAAAGSGDIHGDSGDSGDRPFGQVRTAGGSRRRVPLGSFPLPLLPLPLLLLLLLLLLGLLPLSLAAVATAYVGHGHGDCYQPHNAAAVRGTDVAYLCRTNGNSVAHTYLMYDSLDVYRESKVTAATFSVNAWGNQNDYAKVRVRAHETDDAGNCIEGHRWVQNLALTSASADWTINVQWWNGQWYTSPDIAPVVQEVVNRGGWSRTGNVALVMQRESCTNWKRRTIRTYNDNAVYRSSLSVTFDPGAIEGSWTTSVAGTYYGDETISGAFRVLHEGGTAVLAGADSDLTVTMELRGPGAPGTTELYTGTQIRTLSGGQTTMNDLVVNPVGLVYGTYQIAATWTNDQGFYHEELSANLVLQDRLASMVFAQQPGDGVYGTVLPQQPIIHLLDIDGNIITDGADRNLQVTLSIIQGAGTISGHIRTAGNGVVDNFAVRFAGTTAFTGGPFQLRATVPGSITVDSAVFNVYDSMNTVELDLDTTGEYFRGDTIAPFRFRIRGDSTQTVTVGPDATAPLTLTIGQGSGVLSGTLVKNAVGGFVTFDDISVDGPGFVEANNFKFLCTLPNADAEDTSNTRIRSYASAIRWITGPPTPWFVGDDFTPRPNLELIDIEGNRVVLHPTERTLEATVSTMPGFGGTLTGTLTKTAANGLMNGAFNPLRFVDDATFTEPGPTRLVATVVGGGSVELDISGLSPIIEINARAATIFTTTPIVAFSDQPFDIVVFVQDNLGRNVTVGPDANIDVTVTLAAGTGALTLGTGTLVNGTGTIPVQIGGGIFVASSLFQLTVTGTADNTNPTTTSSTFTMHQGAAEIVIATQPSSTLVGGDPLTTQPEIEVHDANGAIVQTGPQSELTIVASMNTATGLLAGARELVTFEGSVVFSDLAVGFPGFVAGNVHRLDFDVSGGMAIATVTSDLFDLATSVAYFAVTTQPVSGLTRLGPFSIGVEAYDGDNNLLSSGPHSSLTVRVDMVDGTGVTGGTNTVTLSGGTGTISGIVVGMPFVQGFATFNVTSVPPRAGVFGVTDGTSFIFNAATQIGFSTQPVCDCLVGDEFAVLPVLTVQDDDGTLVDSGPDFVPFRDISLTTNGPGVLEGDLVGQLNAHEFTPISLNVRDGASFTNPNAPFQLVASVPGFPDAFSSDFYVGDRIANLIETGSLEGNHVSYEELRGTYEVVVSGQRSTPILHGPHSRLRLEMTVMSASSTGYADNGLYMENGVFQACFNGIYVGWPNFDRGSHRFRFEIHPDNITSTGFHSVISDMTVVQPSVASINLMNPDPIPNRSRGGALGFFSFELLDEDGDRITTGRDEPIDVEIEIHSSSTGTGTIQGGATSLTVEDSFGFTPNLRIDGPGFTSGDFFIEIYCVSTNGRRISFISNKFAVYDDPDHVHITRQPVHNGFRGETFATKINLRVHDAAHGILTGGSASDATFTASLSTGSGQLLNVPPKFNDGKVTLTNVVIDDPGFVPGEFKIKISTGFDGSTITQPFFVYEQAASLRFRVQPVATDIVSGDLMTAVPEVDVLDADNDVVTLGPHADGSIDLVLVTGTGNGTWSGMTTYSAVNGTIVSTAGSIGFPNFAPGTFRFKATFNGIQRLSSSFTIHARAVELLFRREPVGDAVEDTTFSTTPRVGIVDASGNDVATGPHSDLAIQVALSSGTRATLTGATATASSGVAMFNLISIGGPDFHPSDTFSLNATSTTGPLLVTSTDSATFVIWGRPALLRIATEPSAGPFLTGTAIPVVPEVDLVHATGTVITVGQFASATVSASLIGGTGTISLGSSATAVTGRAVFTGLTVNPSGLTPATTFQIRFSIGSPPLSVDSITMTIHDSASSLTFDVAPVGDRHGQVLSTLPVVHVLDANSQLVADGAHAGETVALALAELSGTGTLLGSTSVAASGGVATFGPMRVDDPGFSQGTFRLEASMLGGSIATTSITFSVGGTLDSLIFDTEPIGDVFDGDALSVGPIVHLLDASGNRIAYGSHSNLNVDLSLSGGQTSLASGTSATASNGIASFPNVVVSSVDFVPSNTFRIRATVATPFVFEDSQIFEMFARATELRFTISPTGRYLTQDVLPDPQVELVHDDSNSRVSAGLHASTTVKIELLNNLALATTTVSTAAFEGLADGFPALVMDPTTLPAGDSGELFFLRATILGDSVVVDSTTFRVDATATQLVFSTEPVGNMFPTELLTTMPVVEVLDVNGNRVDTGLHSSLDVTLSLGAGPDNADLVGTATASLAGGIATWADISVDNTTYPVNRTFVLTATETTIPLTVDSATFDVFLAFIVGPLPEFQAYTETTVAGTLSYELILEPTTDVLLRLSGTDDMLIIDGVSSTTASGVEAVLTFTPLDWSDAQTIDIFAIDNDIDEVNNTRHVVVTSTINSTDSRFDVWTIPPTTVDVIDDDMVGYVGPSVVNHTIADEDGGRSTFNLRLTSEPLFAVTIESAAASSLVPRLAEVRHAGDDRIVFTPSNWDTTAVVTVEAVDNDLPKGTQDFIVPWSVESDDPSYHELELDEIRVVIEDDDQANIPTVSLAEEKIVIYTNTGSENLFYRDFFFVNSTFFEIEEVICTYSSIHDDKFEVDQGPSIAYRTSHSPHYGNLTFLATEEKGAVTVSVTAKYAGGVMTTAPVKFTISVEATPTPLISRIVPNNGPAQGGTPAVITGNYFGETPENLTVTIADGVPCAGGAEWVSITKVICTTSPAPMQNSSGPIYVETALGRKESTTVIYTYNPDPVINSVSQWSMDVGILSPVLVAGLNFGFSSSDVTSVTFAGVPCTDLVYLNTSALLCTPGTVDAPTSGPVRIETTSHGFVETTRSFSYIMPVVEQVIYHRSPADKPWVLTVVGHDFGPSPVTNVTIDNVDCLTFVELPPNVDNKDVIECRMPIGWENDPTFPCVDVVSETGGKGICDADVVHEFPLPVVTSIVPNRMSVTDSGLLDITLHGHDFGLTAESFVNTSMVSTQSKTSPMFCFGGLAVWISPEEIRCRLPDTGYNVWSETDKVFIGATVGIETLNGVGPRDKRFTFEPARYPPPVISDITPKVGSAVPLDVTLTGEFFGLLGNDSITIEFQGPFGFAKCLEPTWKSPERVTCKSPRFFDFNMTVDDNKDRTYPFRITVGDETSAIVDRGFEYQLQLNTPVLLSVAPTILPLEGGLGWIFAHQIDIQVFGYVGDFEQFATESSTQPIEFVTNICLSEDLCVVEEEEEAGRLRQMFNDTVDPGSAGGTNGTSGGDVDVPDVLVPEEPIEEEAEEVYTVVVERGGCAADNATCLFEANGFPISTELRASLVKECEGLILCRAILVKFPPQPEEGLYSITFERIDREEAGFDTIENVLFYTGGCAEDGKWGPSRTDCRDCPKGGICTGGSSVAAAPGYWTPNPGSDYVVECYPQERCLGGANGDCAEGYDGEVCGRCADGYYLYAQVCKDCPPKLTVLIFLVVAAAVWTFFCFVVYYVKKRTTLSFLVSFLMGVQILAAIGDMTPNKAPTWIQVPAWFLKLFMADFSFIVFDCWRYVPFWVYYLLGLAYSLAVIVLMYIVGKVFQGMRLSYYRNHGTKATYEERALYYRNRITRAFSIGVQVIYLTLVTRGLEVLSCTQRVDGQWRLVVRQDVLCYEGDHWISGGVAIGILVLIGLGYPLGYLWFMLKYRHKETDPVTGIVSGGLWRNESFMERYNFGYSLFKREHEGFFFMEIAVLIGLAGAKAHLATHPRYQMGVPVLFFLMKLCLVIFYRPYEHVKFNLIQMLICLGAMTALCTNWFYHVEWMNNTVPSLMAFAVAALFGLAYVWLLFNIGVAMVAPPEEVGGTYLEDDISDDDFFTEIKEEMPTVIGASEVFQYGMMKSIDEQEALAGDSIYVLGPDGLPIEDEEGDYVLTRKEIARRRLDETYEPTLLEWVDMKFFDDDDYADEIAEILAERELAMAHGMAAPKQPQRRLSVDSVDASFGFGGSDSDGDSFSGRERILSGASRSSQSTSLGDEIDLAENENVVPPIPLLESVGTTSEDSGQAPSPGKGKMSPGKGKGKGKFGKGKGKFMMKGKGKFGKGKGKASP